MARESKSDRIRRWLDRLNRFSQTDQTVAEFCAAESVSLPTFYQWKRRLSPRVIQPKRPRKRTTGRGRKQQAAFTQLTVVDPPATTASVSLPGGITIELGTGHDAIVTIVEQVLQHSIQTQATVQRASSC